LFSAVDEVLFVPTDGPLFFSLNFFPSRKTHVPGSREINRLYQGLFSSSELIIRFDRMTGLPFPPPRQRRYLKTFRQPGPRFPSFSVLTTALGGLSVPYRLFPRCCFFFPRHVHLFRKNQFLPESDLGSRITVRVFCSCSRALLKPPSCSQGLTDPPFRCRGVSSPVESGNPQKNSRKVLLFVPPGILCECQSPCQRQGRSYLFLSFSSGCLAYKPGASPVFPLCPNRFLFTKGHDHPLPQRFAPSSLFPSAGCIGVFPFLSSEILLAFDPLVPREDILTFSPLSCRYSPVLSILFIILSVFFLLVFLALRSLFLNPLGPSVLSLRSSELDSPSRDGQSNPFPPPSPF